MRAIIFDFGGTIDTDGIHWLDQYIQLYKEEDIISDPEQVKQAFINAERKMPGIIQKDFSLLQTFKEKITFHFEFFSDNKLIERKDNINVIDKLADQCYNITINNSRESIPILQKLKRRYELALVSNYYGNLYHVCEEIKLSNLFTEIIDSAVVGCRKPDWKIFGYTLDKLQLDAEDTFVVGDSYKNDILPGKSIGCKTILINKNGTERGSRPGIDYNITSLKELERIVF